MKLLYGIEPDLCIQYPEIITDNSKDIILPLYFYQQLEFLTHNNVQDASEAAAKIFSFCLIEDATEFLIFKNLHQGTVYFINQEKSLDNVKINLNQFDLRNPIDRYMISLFDLAEHLGSQVSFLAVSSQIVAKCHHLNFNRISQEDFIDPGTSWLTYDLIREIPSAIDPVADIIWQEDEEISESEEKFLWIDIQ
ncbi:hypothetical protein PA905_10700 [Planktothrix agardhii CCAP 1459/11A]|jgi:hypothetical protein|uniref:Uncharacterized protein n=1 Tax=Planktothrix agardhii CCAP 1459/11A TaxID=282420 RepID=A0A4P5ZTG8_PLAAG|nr:hypothetical protein [Planktothrix agardhii]CAD5973218.1 hypothetical protein NO108_04299 [Planktothrix rubescens]MCP9296536.1 hypothetical protein [Planktothrix agardhii LY1]CAD5913257.1 hypothetical protein NO2A_00610 [Planktothrix agardhii]CAD5977823.1 hypothetical protein NO758_04263 [Planktothrix agardhii]GDZ93235.1 hypothetical protein PA905_10700 [Planktothrix agardhii CCAP 1459/11A]